MLESMEPDGAWAPCQFQLANWTYVEETAAGFPVEYATIDMLAGTPGFQGYVPDESTGGQQHLLEYHDYYSAASQHNGTSEISTISNDSRARDVVEHVIEFNKANDDMMKEKMHRYPASLRDIDECYTRPRIVAIGPYHRYHGQEELKQAEKVKHLAACHCVMESGYLLEDLYPKVVSAADDARHLYDEDVLVGLGDDDFRHMMFFDACFLVQYIRMMSASTSTEIDESLFNFLSPNRFDIFHDITLLENQIPWQLVEVVMGLNRVPLDKLSGLKHSLKDKFLLQEKFLLPEKYDVEYKPPPHFLGLFRYYIVGKRTNKDVYKPTTKSISFSVSAIELAEIGITLKANTDDLVNMRLNKDMRCRCLLWFRSCGCNNALFPELSLAPLSLDCDRASYLINMAALEQCMFRRFSGAPDEDSAVCSYTRLLAMLVHREEDVHELRARGILQGGGGLTNKDVLSFFKNFQYMRPGSCYHLIMEQIQSYKENSSMKTKLHRFCYNNKKTIAAVFSVIFSVGGIIGTIMSVKNSP